MKFSNEILKFPRKFFEYDTWNIKKTLKNMNFLKETSNFAKEILNFARRVSNFLKLKKKKLYENLKFNREIGNLVKETSAKDNWFFSK